MQHLASFRPRSRRDTAAIDPGSAKTVVPNQLPAAKTNKHHVIGKEVFLCSFPSGWVRGTGANNKYKAGKNAFYYHHHCLIVSRFYGLNRRRVGG